MQTFYCKKEIEFRSKNSEKTCLMQKGDIIEAVVQRNLSGIIVMFQGKEIFSTETLSKADFQEYFCEAEIVLATGKLKPSKMMSTTIDVIASDKASLEKTGLIENIKFLGGSLMMLYTKKKVYLYMASMLYGCMDASFLSRGSMTPISGKKLECSVWNGISWTLWSEMLIKKVEQIGGKFYLVELTNGKNTFYQKSNYKTI